MNKLILKAVDGQIEYEYQKATLYSSKYNSKLKRLSLHTPLAAKIIFSVENTLTLLLVKQPIIYIDEKSELTIWTSSTINEATLVDKPVVDKVTAKINNTKQKLFLAKSKLGLTESETIKKSLLESDIEMTKIISLLDDFTHEGGFDV